VNNLSDDLPSCSRQELQNATCCGLPQHMQDAQAGAEQPRRRPIVFRMEGSSGLLRVAQGFQRGFGVNQRPARPPQSRVRR
jgi:hypothetical protein